MGSATSATDVTHDEWFVVLSNVAFALPAFVSLRRRQWFRALAFTTIIFVSGTFHLSADTPVLPHSDHWQRWDSILSLYLVCSVVLLLAHFHAQAVELLLEVLVFGAVVGWWHWWVDLHGQDRLVHSPLLGYVLPPAGVFLLVVLPTWCVHGVIPVRRQPVAWGLLFGAAAVVCYVVGTTNAGKQHVTHGLWHIFAALASAALVYGLRDPATLDGYHVLMGDIL